MSKNPYIAGVLNFFTFGGGTLYIGKRILPGVLITIGGTIVQAAEIYSSPPVMNLIPAVWPFLIGGIVILKIGLVIDGYREAVAVNNS
jgi:hypothetical protein